MEQNRSNLETYQSNASASPLALTITKSQRERDHEKLL